jgi:hypothetical protein
MTTGRINQVANHVTPHQPVSLRIYPNRYRPAGRLDNPRLLQFKSSLLRRSVLRCNNQSRLLLTWHFLLPFGTCSNPRYPNRQLQVALLPTYSHPRWPEVQFSIPVAHSLNTGTVSPDNRIQIYSYALRKSKPTSFLEIAENTRVGREYR